MIRGLLVLINEKTFNHHGSRLDVMKLFIDWHKKYIEWWKKKFQYSLEWEKNQLAIWDNRSMLHQATPFKGNRIMHRITIH